MLRLFLLIVGGLLLANIVGATFIWPPTDEPVGPREPVVNAATVQGQEPWMVNEKYNAPNRDRTRKGMLDELSKPWANYCTPEGHELLTRLINNYFGQRETQAWSYEHTYGAEARRYVIKAWATTDDNHIERLMTETYGRGYFTLEELRSDARKWLAPLVKDTRVTGKPCES